MAHDDDNPLGLKCLSGSADVADQRQAAQLVQYLCAPGSHSGSQACGQYEHF
jgi:hypothetical protein